VALSWPSKRSLMASQSSDITSSVAAKVPASTDLDQRHVGRFEKTTDQRVFGKRIYSH
jgi:hypothetical protein